jgi:putative transposase
VDANLAPEVKELLHGRWEPMYRSQLHFLVMWGTRARRPVLRERHLRALQLLMKEISDERGFALLEVAAGPDHVHLLVCVRPTQSIASVVREIKGRSAVALLAQFPELRVWLRGNLVWDERYAVETVSATRIDRVRERLRATHAPPEDYAEAS